MQPLKFCVRAQGAHLFWMTSWMFSPMRADRQAPHQWPRLGPETSRWRLFWQMHDVMLVTYFCLHAPWPQYSRCRARPRLTWHHRASCLRRRSGDLWCCQAFGCLPPRPRLVRVQRAADETKSIGQHEHHYCCIRRCSRQASVHLVMPACKA